MHPSALCSSCGEEYALPDRDLCPDCLREEKQASLLEEIQAERDRRSRLLGGMAGGTFQRLNEIVSTAITEELGLDRCAELGAGGLECFCDYCKAYWSRLREAQNGGSRPKILPRRRPAASRLRRAG